MSKSARENVLYCEIAKSDTITADSRSRLTKNGISSALNVVRKIAYRTIARKRPTTWYVPAP